MFRLLFVCSFLCFLHQSSAYPAKFNTFWWQNCQLLDMTYELSSETIAYPVKRSLKFIPLKSLTKNMVPSPSGGFYLHMNEIRTEEHMGTHMDAPNHLLKTLKEANEMWTLEKIPLTSMIGEACVIDVPEKYKLRRSNYRLTVPDILKWEEENGPLNENCIILLRTGQERYWGHLKHYVGSDTPEALNSAGMPYTLAWPGLGPQTASWILHNRGLKAFGVDAMSLDVGGLTDFRDSVHTVFLGANKPGLENVANLSKLPTRGATVIALPMKNKGGSGSPVRIMAYGWNGPNDPCRFSYSSAPYNSVLFSLLLFLVLLVFC